MTFFTRSNLPEMRCSPNGSRIRKRKELHIDAFGNKRLRVVQEVDQYKVIQSYAEETKIENILNAYENGDVSVLQRKPGAFFDATEMPTDLAGAYEVLRQAEATYNSLDPDDRASFGSFQDFLNECGTAEGLVRIFGNSDVNTDIKDGSEEVDNA